MNWKEMPNLFCNGMFGLQIKSMTDLIKDWSVNNKGKIMWWCYFCGGQGEWVTEKIDDCKLIARPISDMSYEEMDYLCLEIDTKDWYLDAFYMETPEPFLYLLSIGVYPFKDTTDVIFIDKDS